MDWMAAMGLHDHNADDPKLDPSIDDYQDQTIEPVNTPEELEAAVRKHMGIAVWTNVKYMAGQINKYVGDSLPLETPEVHAPPEKLIKFTYGGVEVHHDRRSVSRFLHTKDIDDTFLQVSVPFPPYREEDFEEDLDLDVRNKDHTLCEIMDSEERYLTVYYTVPKPVPTTNQGEEDGSAMATDVPSMRWSEGWIASDKDPLPETPTRSHGMALLRHAMAVSVLFGKHIETRLGTASTCFVPTALNGTQRAWVNYSAGLITVIAQKPSTGGTTIKADSTETLCPVAITGSED